MELIVAGIQPGFLSEDEISLLMWVLRQNENAIAFDDSERGCFKQKYFPDYIIETVPHIPWAIRPLRVPESVKEEMNDMLRDQKESGNLETSESSYRSRMFVVQKPKGGLRIVHDLQPLNLVSVQDVMLPPNVSEFAEDFIGYAIYGTMDLYSGYHQRRLHPDSRALTATWIPNLGTVQLTSLPMGYTNSMQEFQRATNHIVYNMGTEKAQSFVDDIGAKGPKTRYNDDPIPLNPNIRRFVWEYAHTLFEVLATLIEAGATASGKKLVLAAEKVNIVGHICSLHGIRPHHGIVTKVMNWPTPINVTGVRGFLGTVGVARNWIRSFAKIAKPLTELTKLSPHEFEWNTAADEAVKILKEKVQHIVSLKKLDIKLAKKASLEAEPGKISEGRLILAVDSSIIAIGFVLYQVLWDNDPEIRPEEVSDDDQKERSPGTHIVMTARSRAPRLKKFPLRFGSITLNEVESRYSQPKVELYGLFRSLKAMEYLLWGVRVLVEIDASFLAKTANAPGLPNAAATRWVAYIRLFDLEYKHVPAEQHKAPDGLSRRPRAINDSDDTDIEDNTDDEGPFIRGITTLGPPLEAPIIMSSLDRLEIEHASLKGGIHFTEYRPPLSLIEVNPVEHELRRSARLRKIVQAVTPRAPDLIKNKGDQPEALVTKHIEAADFAQFKDIHRYIATRHIPNNIVNKKAFVKSTKGYFVHNKILWKKSKGGARRVVIWQDIREDLITQAHDRSGHKGRDPTYKKLADFYYWPRMVDEIGVYCRTCEECQLRSTYRPKVPINPTWVATVFRKFNMDLVEPGIESDGYNFIIDMRDDLTGWLEARTLEHKTSDAIAKFIYQDVICRYGCIPQITTDNGKEFLGAVKLLAERYGIKIVHSSPYHPEGNGMIERGHFAWIESIFKLCGRKKHHWSRWVYPAMWADRVTTKRTTRFSPFYLLYGVPHLFPFALEEETWYTTQWHNINTTVELLTIRAMQFTQLRSDRKSAAKNTMDARKKAAETFAKQNTSRLMTGKYRPGEYVLIAMKGKGIKKGYGRIKSADRWAGPFKVHARYRVGSYILKELDNTIVRGSVPASHLRPFYTRQKQIKEGELVLKHKQDERGEYQWSAGEEDDDARDSLYREYG